MMKLLYGSCYFRLLTASIVLFVFPGIELVRAGVVRLAWDPNPEGNVAGYHIYRSDTSGGPFSRLDTTLLAVTDYRDDSVEGGHSYYYAVTAVDSRGLESAFSQELMVSVPIYDSNTISSSLTARSLPDLKVSAGEMVILSGNSWALDGSDFHYSWAQVPDSTVTLAGPDTAEATFIAPYVSSEIVLTFVFTVTGDYPFTARDILKVTVCPR